MCRGALLPRISSPPEHSPQATSAAAGHAWPCHVYGPAVGLAAPMPGHQQPDRLELPWGPSDASDSSASVEVDGPVPRDAVR